MNGFVDIKVPSLPKALSTATDMLTGPLIDPISRVLLYSSDEWEKFVDEWVSDCLKPKYVNVQRFSGPNDRGVDIAGFADDKLLLGVWDNYQCKHYKDPLIPTDVWVEIGKILWHSFSGHYKAPRTVIFVAPRGPGATLLQLLANPSALSAGLIKAWAQNCANDITKSQTIALHGAFAAYVDAFDFSIFKGVMIREVIEQHKKSPYFVARFGGGLPPRPVPDKPPQDIDPKEHRYVAALLEAYGDHTKQKILNTSSLTPFKSLAAHFQRQREAFYHAESFRVFVRDKVEPGTFESLQDEIYKGVVDTQDATHPDGYQRVVAVIQAAQNLPLTAHPLSPSTFISDKHGICHQLANDERLTWTK